MLEYSIIIIINYITNIPSFQTIKKYSIWDLYLLKLENYTHMGGFIFYLATLLWIILDEDFINRKYIN